MHLILDFDDTITTKDTISCLADIALQHHEENQSQQDAHAPARLRAAWDSVVQAYMADLSRREATYTPPASHRRSLSHERAYLRGSKDVELASLDRVRRSHVFLGITEDLFRKAGAEARRQGKVVVRKGFEGLIEKIRRLEQEQGKEGVKVVIVSANWSKAFIEGVLGLDDRGIMGVDGEVIEVISNETVPEDGSIIGPRTILEKEDGERRVLVTNSEDKLAAMKSILSREKPAQPVTGGGQSVFVYFGDSTTDLECLMAANRGIVIANTAESTLLQTLRHIGVGIAHVSEAKADSEARATMLWARDFDEVSAFWEDLGL